MTTNVLARRLLTTQEVAKALRTSETTVYRMVGDGRLEPIRLHPHGRFRFREEDVAALIEGRS